MPTFSQGSLEGQRRAIDQCLAKIKEIAADAVVKCNDHVLRDGDGLTVALRFRKLAEGAQGFIEAQVDQVQKLANELGEAARE